MDILGYFFIAIAKILDGLLWAYMVVVIIRALLSWVQPNPYNPVVRFINGLVDPVTYRISRVIPTRIGMVELSPLILLVIVMFLREFLVRVIYSIGGRFMS